MTLASLEEILQDDPRVIRRPDPTYAEETVERIENQRVDPPAEIQQQGAIQTSAGDEHRTGSEVDISSRINRSGRPSQEEIQSMIDSGDAQGLINAFQPPVDMVQRMKMTSRMGSEAIGNALASLGGFYTARGGAPVTPIDRSRIDNIANQIAQQETQDAALKHQHNMLELQQALKQIEQKRTLQQQREDAQKKFEQEKEMRKIVPGHITGQFELEEARRAGLRERDDLLHDHRIELQKLRNMPQWARIKASQERVSQAQARDRVSNDRSNPIVIDLYDDQEGRSLGSLRQVQANTLLSHILNNNQEALQYIQRNFNLAFIRYETTGRIPPELATHIILTYYKDHPEATKEMLENSRRHGDQFLLREDE